MSFKMKRTLEMRRVESAFADYLENEDSIDLLWSDKSAMSFLPSMRKRINLKAVRIYILHRSFATDCWMIWPSP